MTKDNQTNERSLEDTFKDSMSGIKEVLGDMYLFAKLAFAKDPLQKLKEAKWQSKVEDMLKSPQTVEDFNALGKKYNEAIDNKLNVNIWDYQMRAARKRAEVCYKWKNIK